MTRKLYTGPITDVCFDGELCQHSGNCVRGLPDVFNTSARPWIAAGTVASEQQAERLREVVATCPSGALAMVEHEATA